MDEKPSHANANTVDTLCNATALTAVSRPSGEQVNDGYEKRGANDRPQHGEMMTADVDQEGFRELELHSNPGSKKRSDESKNDRNDQPSPNPTGDGLSDGAANGRDYKENQDLRK